jgi:hypothetical protein
MKLGELLDQLTALDPETTVGVASGCHGCAGFSDITVDYDRDERIVWIIDEHR